MLRKLGRVVNDAEREYVKVEGEGFMKPSTKDLDEFDVKSYAEEIEKENKLAVEVLRQEGREVAVVDNFAKHLDSIKDANINALNVIAPFVELCGLNAMEPLSGLTKYIEPEVMTNKGIGMFITELETAYINLDDYRKGLDEVKPAEDVMFDQLINALKSLRSVLVTYEVFCKTNNIALTSDE